MLQRVPHAHDHVLPALACVEDTGSVVEPAVRVIELAALERCHLDRVHRLDRLRHFLPIRSDVLHRRTTNAARNPAQTLDPHAMMRDGRCDEPVPIFSRACVEVRDLVPMPVIEPADRHLQHQPRPSRVEHHQIASASQYKQWQCSFSRKFQCLAYIVLIPCLDEIPRRPTYAQSSERPQQHIFLNVHAIPLYRRALHTRHHPEDRQPTLITGFMPTTRHPPSNGRHPEDRAYSPTRREPALSEAEGDLAWNATAH